MGKHARYAVARALLYGPCTISSPSSMVEPCRKLPLRNPKRKSGDSDLFKATQDPTSIVKRKSHHSHRGPLSPFDCSLTGAAMTPAKTDRLPSSNHESPPTQVVLFTVVMSRTERTASNRVETDKCNTTMTIIQLLQRLSARE